MAITEKITNLARTTLSGAMSDGSGTSLTVTSASLFPSSGQFRIRIQDEIMLVTAGAGTTSWTVTRAQEGTTGVSHANGSMVYLVITAGTLDHLISNHSHSGGSEGLDISTPGWQTSAFPVGFDSDTAYTTSGMALAANGGTVMVPFVIHSKMAIGGVSVSMADAATARAWSWTLWQEPLARGNTMELVARSVGQDSWTPSGASVRTLAAYGAPVLINAGTYWLAIHNSHASNTLSVGYTAATTFTGTKAQTKALTPYVYNSTSNLMRIAASPDGTRLLTSPSGSGLVMINTVAGTSANISGTAYGSGGICADPTNTYFYSVQLGGSTVYRVKISDNSMTSVSVSSGITSANGIMIDPAGAYVYVAGTNSTVAIVRTSDFTYLSSFTIGTVTAGNSGGCVMDPAGVYGYFGRGGGNQAVRVLLSDKSTTTGTANMPAGNSTYIPMAIKPDGTKIAFPVNNPTAGYIGVITTSSMTGGSYNSTVAQSATGLAADDTNVYFTQSADNSQTKMTWAGSFTKYTPFPASSTPNGLVMDPINAGFTWTCIGGTNPYYVGYVQGDGGVLSISSLDATAATWSAQTYGVGAYIQGRPFGGNTNW